MKRFDSWQAWGFLGALVVVAYVVNNMGGGSSPVAPAPRSQPPSKQDIALQRENRRRRYLNLTRPLGKSSIPTLALAVATDQGSLDASLAGLIEEMASSPKLKIISGLFTPEFVSDGLFQQVTRGSLAPLTELDVAKFLDGALLGYRTVSYSSDASLGILNAQIRLEVTHLKFGAGLTSRGWTYSAKGVGFKKEDALLKAEEVLKIQIRADTNNWSIMRKG